MLQRWECKACGVGGFRFLAGNALFLEKQAPKDISELGLYRMTRISDALYAEKRWLLIPIPGL